MSNQDDTKERDQRGNLFHPGKGFMDEERACPAGNDRSKEG